MCLVGWFVGCFASVVLGVRFGVVFIVGVAFRLRVLRVIRGWVFDTRSIMRCLVDRFCWRRRVRRLVRWVRLRF